MAITTVNALGTPAAPAAAPAPAPEQAAPADPKPAEPGTTVEVDLKPEELKGFTNLSRQLREAQAKVKELEGKVTVPAEQATAAEKLAAAQALVKDGKHLAAARALGIDLDAATTEYLAEDKPGEVKDPRFDAFLAEQAAAKAKAEAEAAEKAKADEAAANTARETAHVAATEHVKSLVAASPDKWTRVAKDAEAPADVLKVAEAAVRKIGRAVSDEEASSIFLNALDEVELDRRVREAIEAERAKAEQPQGREVKLRRELVTREIDTGERRQPSPTIGPARGNTRTAPPETQQMSAREAKALMLKEFKGRRPAS